MLHYRIFPAVVLACPVVLLTGAVGQRAVPSAVPDCPPPACGLTDPTVAALLQQAASRLAPERTVWLETRIWQRVSADGLAYQAEGRFVVAPGNRRSMHLQITVGRTRGQVDVVSDGQQLWQRTQIGGGGPSLTRVAVAGPAVLGQQGVLGPSELLGVLRQQLQKPRREVVLWGGRQVIRITGEWPTEGAAPGAQPAEGLASAAPRRCRLYLDHRTLWPIRVEWWAREAAAGDVLLSATEFRDPVVNQPLPADRCAREFVAPAL